jgi:hypothetical protein
MTSNQYNALTLLSRLLDMMNLVEYAITKEGLTDAEKARAQTYYRECRDIYGDRRYLPDETTENLHSDEWWQAELDRCVGAEQAKYRALFDAYAELQAGDPDVTAGVNSSPLEPSDLRELHDRRSAEKGWPTPEKSNSHRSEPHYFHECPHFIGYTPSADYKCPQCEHGIPVNSPGACHSPSKESLPLTPTGQSRLDEAEKLILRMSGEGYNRAQFYVEKYDLTGERGAEKASGERCKCGQRGCSECGEDPSAYGFGPL